MTARPSARRPEHTNIDAGQTPELVVKGNDIRAQSAGAREHRVSAGELDRLRAVLGPRDWSLIEMLGRVRLATGHQLRRATFTDDTPATRRAARRQLERLVRWRVIARLERRQGGLGRGSDAWTYGLDTAGQRLASAGNGRRPRLPHRDFWRHILLGAEAYVRLVETLRGTDRELSAWHGEPQCWRDYLGPHGARQRLKPDGFVVVSGPDFDDVRFLEVDTGSQSAVVIRQKLRQYLAYARTGQEQQAQGGVFPLTVFLTTSPRRHGQLVDLVAELPETDWRWFAVGLIEDAGRLLGGAP